jgi:hypothetical protein
MLLEAWHSPQRGGLRTTFIIIPHEIGTTTTTLWIGAKGEGGVPHKPVRLDLNGESRQMGDNWRVWQTFADTDPQDFAPADHRMHEAISKDEPIRERIYYQRLESEGLERIVYQRGQIYESPYVCWTENE